MRNPPDVDTEQHAEQQNIRNEPRYIFYAGHFTGK